MLKVSVKSAVLTFFITVFSGQLSAQNGQVNIDEPNDVKQLMEFKKDLRTVNLLTIQVYSGNRTDAQEIRDELNKSEMDFPVSLKFETPNYKVWIGNFTTRLEADRALVIVKEDFPNAFILKPKIKAIPKPVKENE
ncbi:MAG: hypothetical protein BM564_06855 [Bacteroidetes bacterium MedPE-SWsnd-G2]|nr:MAG: hypothetical protein BM564_06855 [Bacteroidetes bacterium MedPE-SWsnd-G2]